MLPEAAFEDSGACAHKFSFMIVHLVIVHFTFEACPTAPPARSKHIWHLPLQMREDGLSQQPDNSAIPGHSYRGMAAVVMVGMQNRTSREAESGMLWDAVRV